MLLKNVLIDKRLRLCKNLPTGKLYIRRLWNPFIMKKKITIIGSVHDVGYRPFLLGIAESLEIERFFADNTYINGRQAVFTLIDSSEEKVNAFLEIVSSKFPENSQVEKVESEDYSGNVMKTENYYRYLTAMQLSKIATYGGKMLKKQDETTEAIKSVKEDTTAMLTKQDETIEAIKSVKEDTTMMLEKQDETIKAIKSVKEDTSAMLQKQDETIQTIKSVKEDTSAMLNKQDETIRAIKEEGEKNREAFKDHLASDIARIYEEIDEIKATLARVLEKVGA
jgi:acylphosphatase